MIGRIWIVLLVTLLLVIVPPAHTQQQAKIFKIGWLAAGPATGTSLKGFLQEFRSLWLCRGQKYRDRVSICEW